MSALLFTSPTIGDPRLLGAYETLKRGTLYQKYAQANPRESARIDAYWYGGAQTTAATPTGQALLGWADIYRSH